MNQFVGWRAIGQWERCKYIFLLDYLLNLQKQAQKQTLYVGLIVIGQSQKKYKIQKSPYRSLYVSFHPVAAAAAKSCQSCPTLCGPIDGSPPRSPVPGILQARTLEWDAISFSNAWKWQVKVKSLSGVRLLVTPWTAAYQASLSMGFSRQENPIHN